MGVILTVAGLSLIVAGLFILYGPWTLVASGVGVVAAAVAVDWERLS